MKAIVFTKYGSPDVLKAEEVEKPIPGIDEVLVKIHSASANPLDWHRMRGTPFLLRFIEGLFKPKNTRIGADIAGRVEVVSSNIKKFQPGDEVFGSINAGGFAEYACAKENNFVLKPANISFEAASAVPVAAFTALQSLRDKGQIQAGQKVLINGAAGGVGTFAIQIAVAFGAEVTGVCSTRNLELVRSLKADHVIDYTKEDFSKNGQHYDLILDMVANHSIADYKRALSPQGICVIAGFSTLFHLFQNLIMGALASKTGSQKIENITAKVTQKDLVFIKELLETCKITPVIDRHYPFSETKEAMRYLETGHARGKVVITLETNFKK